MKATAVILLVLSALVSEAQGRPQATSAQTRPAEEQAKVATLDKYPIGYRLGLKEQENFLETYRKYYIRPRAFPETAIDPRLRLRAYRQLREMRDKLNKPHINPGWLNEPQSPGRPWPGRLRLVLGRTYEHQRSHHQHRRRSQ